LLTAFLVQSGSPESRRPTVKELVDADPRDFADEPDVPWPVKRGGWVLPHGDPRPTLSDYLLSARFWFESFQNWQSEFLAIASMVWLASVPQAAVFTRTETGACATP
jgi:hypothetical protein